MEKEKNTFNQAAIKIKKIITLNGHLPNINYQDPAYISKIAKSVNERMTLLFHLEKNAFQTDHNLYVLTCFETYLHFIDYEYQNKRKSIINNLNSTPELTSHYEVCSFFLPYFTNENFKEYNTEYFQEFHNKINDFLLFYSLLSIEAKTSPCFSYVINDLKTFVQCLYTRGPLPKRDYKKLYNFLINQ